jgi:predicted nucleotidyltransferase
MDKAFVIETLRRHRAELQEAGVEHLVLFGSVARGESSVQSDIDLMAEFNPEKRRTLLTMVRLEDRLGELLGNKVDLSPAHAMNAAVRARALREAIHAF